MPVRACISAVALSSMVNDSTHMAESDAPALTLLYDASDEQVALRSASSAHRQQGAPESSAVLPWGSPAMATAARRSRGEASAQSKVSDVEHWCWSISASAPRAHFAQAPKTGCPTLSGSLWHLTKPRLEDGQVQG
ncbi:hypothetical protein ColTof4_10731 [Colletotrichum tofieldiae]|nr:hypothetical protein ColTof3_06849 [Colletotrichum tofieldiae]GKT78308.1 hypothetical protein ColTof4_10731 [Colletotrichum tofieldiae]